MSFLQQFNFLERTGAHTQGIADMFSSDVCKHSFICRGDFQGSSFLNDSWRWSKLETLSWLAGLLLVIVTSYASKGRFCPSWKKKNTKELVFAPTSHTILPLVVNFRFEMVSLQTQCWKAMFVLPLGVELSSLLQHQVLVCTTTQQYINKRKYKFVFFFIENWSRRDCAEGKGPRVPYCVGRRMGTCWKRRLSFPSFHSCGKIISSSFGCELGSNPKGLRW